MSILDWIAFGFLLVITVAAFRNLPRVWRHEFRHFDRAPAYWPWGAALWRGFVRMMPVGVVGCAVLLIGTVVLLLIPEEPSGPFVRPYWAVVPSLIACALPLAGMLGVVLFNRPRAIVPPHLRAQPGALAEWQKAHGGRRRAR